MNKKAIELGLNTIVIAIVVLLVMVLMVYLVASGVLDFKSGTACASKKGKCVDGNSCGDTDPIPVTGDKPLCGGDNQICCKLVPTT